MPRKRHSPEQILGKLREVEVALAKGQTVVGAVRQIAVTEQTYYRWRNEYGGLSIDQARRLKQLEQENARLKRGGGKGGTLAPSTHIKEWKKPRSYGVFLTRRTLWVGFGSRGSRVQIPAPRLDLRFSHANKHAIISRRLTLRRAAWPVLR